MKTFIWRAWLVFILPFMILGLVIQAVWSRPQCFDQDANITFTAYVNAWRFKPKWDRMGGYGGPGL